MGDWKVPHLNFLAISRKASKRYRSIHRSGQDGIMHRILQTNQISRLCKPDKRVLQTLQDSFDIDKFAFFFSLLSSLPTGRIASPHSLHSLTRFARSLIPLIQLMRSYEVGRSEVLEVSEQVKQVNQDKNSKHRKANLANLAKSVSLLSLHDGKRVK